MQHFPWAREQIERQVNRRLPMAVGASALRNRAEALLQTAAAAREAAELLLDDERFAKMQEAELLEAEGFAYLQKSEHVSAPAVVCKERDEARRRTQILFLADVTNYVLLNRADERCEGKLPEADLIALLRKLFREGDFREQSEKEAFVFAETFDIPLDETTASRVIQHARSKLRKMARTWFATDDDEREGAKH